MSETKIHIHVGHFEFYGIRMHLEKKPHWFHRWMLKVFFGIPWIDDIF